MRKEEELQNGDKLEYPALNREGSSSTAERELNLFKETLRAFYLVHNPSRINSLDEILVFYRGKESQLVKGIEEKYNCQLSDFGHVPEYARSIDLNKTISLWSGKIKQALNIPVEDDSQSANQNPTGKPPLPKRLSDTNVESLAAGDHPVHPTLATPTLGQSVSLSNLSMETKNIDEESRTETYRMNSVRSFLGSFHTNDPKKELRPNEVTLFNRIQALETENAKVVQEKSQLQQLTKGIKTKHDALCAEQRAWLRESEAIQRTLANSQKKNEELEAANAQQACRIQELEGRLVELEQKAQDASVGLINKQKQLQSSLEAQQLQMLQLEFLLQSSSCHFNPYDQSSNQPDATALSPSSLSADRMQRPVHVPQTETEVALSAALAETSSIHWMLVRAEKRVEEQENEIRLLSDRLLEVEGQLAAESGSSQTLRDQMESVGLQLETANLTIEKQSATLEKVVQEKEHLEVKLQEANTFLKDAAHSRVDLAAFCLQQREQLESLCEIRIVEAQNRFLMQSEDIESREFELLRLQEEHHHRRLKKSQEEVNRLNKALFASRMELAAREKEMHMLKTELQKAAERIADDQENMISKNPPVFCDHK